MPQAKSNLIVGKKENISDELLLLNPYQIPVLNLVGFGQAVHNTHYGWVEDKLKSMSTVLTKAVTAIDTTVEVEDAAMFRPDQVIKVKEELLRVTQVSAKVVTVERAFGSTVAGTASIGDKVEIMFNLKEEGSDARSGKYIPRESLHNITQIFDDTVKVSGTAQAVEEYGVDDLYLYERMKVQDRLAFELEKAIVNGIRYEDGDIRMMGGIKSYIKSNVYEAAAASITYEMLDNAMLDIFNSGAMKDATRHVLMVSAKQKQVLSTLDNTRLTVYNETSTFGRNVMAVVTNYGELPIITNTNLEADEVMILDANRISVKPLKGRDFTHTYLGIKGDYISGQIVGEYTMEFKQELAHAWIKGLKTA